VRWVVLVALASLASGCSHSWAIAGNVHERAGRSRAIGVVVPMESGRGELAQAPPLAGVEVRCEECGPDAVTTTDADGFFDLPLGRERPEAALRVTFSKPGYRTVAAEILPTEPVAQTFPAPIVVLLEREDAAEPEATEPTEPDPDAAPSAY
jgi:hypothetical protein